MILVVVNVIFCVAFAGFAYVNVNDKEAWLWVLIYMLASVLCALAAFGLFFPMVYVVITGLYCTYAVNLFFVKDGVLDWLTKYKQESIVVSMQATKPFVEKTREFFGLLIISGALVLNYFAG